MKTIRLLRNLKENNRDRIIIGAININTLGGKFEPLVSIVKDKLDIIMISETKIDASYPKSQFNIEGYSEPYRKDRNCHGGGGGGGIILYLKDDIPSKLLNIWDVPEPIEAMFIEITIRKSKWLLVVGYNPQKKDISHFLNCIGKGILPEQ